MSSPKFADVSVVTAKVGSTSELVSEVTAVMWSSGVSEQEMLDYCKAVEGLALADALTETASWVVLA